MLSATRVDCKPSEDRYCFLSTISNASHQILNCHSQVSPFWMNLSNEMIYVQLLVNFIILYDCKIFFLLFSCKVNPYTASWKLQRVFLLLRKNKTLREKRRTKENGFELGVIWWPKLSIIVVWREIWGKKWSYFTEWGEVVCFLGVCDFT